MGYCSWLTVAFTSCLTDGSVELCEFDGTARLKFGCICINAEVFMPEGQSGGQSLNIARSNFGTIQDNMCNL